MKNYHKIIYLFDRKKIVGVIISASFCMPSVPFRGRFCFGNDSLSLAEVIVISDHPFPSGVTLSLIFIAFHALLQLCAYQRANSTNNVSLLTYYFDFDFFFLMSVLINVIQLNLIALSIVICNF